MKLSLIVFIYSVRSTEDIRYPLTEYSRESNKSKNESEVIRQNKFASHGTFARDNSMPDNISEDKRTHIIEVVRERMTKSRASRYFPRRK